MRHHEQTKDSLDTDGKLYQGRGGANETYGVVCVAKAENLN